MKSLLKSALRSVGLHCYTDASLPNGVNWLDDIRRHAEPAENRVLTPDAICFDVGANEGQTTAELLAALPEARIHAFEPFNEPLAKLRRVAMRTSMVHVVPIALGNAVSRVEVRPREHSVYNSLNAAPVGQLTDAMTKAAESIEIDTVDRYCERSNIEHIDILKTDTEGYDLEVLKGASGMLGAGKISYVYCEVTFLAGNRQNTPFIPVYDHLRAFGYDVLGFYETYSMHHFAPPNHFCNALFWRGRAADARMLRSVNNAGLQR